MIELRRILVPTDFSLHAQKALRYAIEFAKKFDAEIVLVHVVEPPPYAPAFVGSTHGDPIPETDEQRKALAWYAEQLEAQARDEIPSSVRSRTALLKGVASVEVGECANREQADLIVMATQGRSGLKDVLLGSTAERVMRRARCPVLVVHHGLERDFIGPPGEEPWQDQ